MKKKQLSETADNKIRKDLDEKFLTPNELGFREQLSKIVEGNENSGEETEIIDSRECWQCDASEFPIKASERVSMFTQLPNNSLTPYEMMNGQIDDDNLLKIYIDMS